MWTIPLLLLMKPKTEALKEFVLKGILWETIFPLIWGTAIGTLFRYAWTYSKRRGWVDKESRLIWTVALALFTIGATELIDSNELLSVSKPIAKAHSSASSRGQP
jgi:NhaP-type Na+/H+ or K+/H+ antiporter